MLGHTASESSGYSLEIKILSLHSEPLIRNSGAEVQQTVLTNSPGNCNARQSEKTPVLYHRRKSFFNTHIIYIYTYQCTLLGLLYS